MRRRSFFSTAASLGVMPLLSKEVRAETKSSGVRITGVEIWRVTGDRDRIEEYRTAVGHGTIRSLRRLEESHTYIRITTNAGVEGFYGPCETRAEEAIRNLLGRSLVGRDPLAVDTIWQRMTSGAHRYTGYHYIIGVSYLDNTLWDLRGKFFDAPVYKLLGGSRNVLDTYVSCIDQSMEPDRVRESAAELKQEGFFGQKWFPSRNRRSWGQKEYEEDVELMRILRETVGPNYDIMIDPLLTWNLTYAMKWCKDVEQYRPRWLEEPVPTAYQIGALARLREMTFIPIASGEHNYGMRDAFDLLNAGAVDVLQIDPEWGGGITELVKICHLAQLYNVIVCPHNQRVTANYHIVASQPEFVCPFVEYLMNVNPNLYYFDKNQIVPKNGQVTIPDLPGLGVELDESKVVKRELVWSTDNS